MKKLQILLIVLSGLFFTACEKDAPTENINENGSIVTNDLFAGKDGVILANSENQLFIQTNYLDNEFNGGGASFRITEVGISEIVDIDGYSMDLTSNDAILNIATHLNPELLPVVDTGTHQVTLKVNGQSISGSAYNPQPITITLEQTFLQISKTNGITLNWKPDPKNELGKIAVSFINRGNLHSPNYTPMTKDSDISIITDDDGNLSITSEQIQSAGFNLDNIIHIYLGRASIAVVGKTAVVYYSTNFLAGKVVN